METVLIADDEQNIREGLKYIVDWKALDFEICGEASNGEDTLQAILKQNPSLVLLDIRMPKMYGTDIIRLAREKGYKGKFIILSGYSDFTYAQTAIRYGVDFYLTKPIDEEELWQALEKIRVTLDSERSKSENINLYKHKAKHVILHEIVTGTYDASETTSLSAEELEEMNLNADVYQVVIYEKFSLNPGDVSYSFADLLKITNKGNHTFEHFEEEGNEVILLKGSFALLKFQGFLDHYEKNPPQKGSPLDSLFLAYGRPVTCLDEIYLSYEEASTLCKRRFFCLQGQHTLGYEELPDVKSRNLEINNDKLSEYCNLLTDYLLSFNRKKVAESLFQLEEYLYNVKNDISSVKLFLTDLYLRIKETINHTYNNMSIPFPTNSECIDKIDSCHYLYEIILFFSEQSEMVMNATGNPSRDTVLDDIIYYIDHNYQNNIKLESIAPLFGYNSAYLGKIFNKTVGESFNSYIDHRRIEQSKDLLEENHLKVYEIAEQVGYNNVDYFHKKFKKYVGISPAEYRKNIIGKDTASPTDL
ncbi:MAG: response regulator [Suilimivivens sp.]